MDIKEDYGKTPDYLTRIQQSISSEYEIVRNMHMKQKYLMTPEEIEQLKLGLNKKWESVKKSINLSHIRDITTVGLERKKEN